MKRIFDIFFSTLVVLFVLPLGFLLSVWILIESRGGVFYLQERIGKGGKKFKLIKFRSMRKNAHKEGLLTVGMRDSRITNSGYFIRKFKLDEFPQFLNVLKGEMSIVGPRPEVEEYVRMYSESQREILQVKPGITDIASLKYFEENRLLGESQNPRQTYIKEIMPAKIELNKEYLDNPTVMNDLKVMWATFLRIIK